MSQRLTPQNLDAEKSLLGAIMIDQSVVLDVMDFVTSDDFYREEHKVIFKAIERLFAKNSPIDLITVSDYLNNEGSLAKAGGQEYIASLTEEIPLASNAVEYAKIVSDKAVQRRMIQLATDIANIGYEPDGPMSSALDSVEQKVFSICSVNTRTKGYEGISKLLHKAYDELSILSAEGKVPGVPSGFTDLDKYTSGFQNSDLIIVAARPGMGKTAFMLNIATNAAKQGKSVAFFNLEMSSLQVTKRLLSAESGVTSEKLRSGELDSDDWMNIASTIDNLDNLKLFVDDSTDVSVNAIRSKCRKLKKEQQIDLIIVDYLQLMSGSNLFAGDKVREVGEITRALKLMAKELNVPVIVGSQLSRSAEKRDDKKPMLSDLRESGNIEQDADIVMFLYRDEYYHKENSDPQLSNLAEVIIEKHRNGARGTVKLAFDAEHASFKNLAFIGDISH